MTEPRIALIAGATGITGRSIAALLTATGGWTVRSLSRSASPLGDLGTPVAVDLHSAADCLAKRDAFADVTHLFYTARSPQPSLAEETTVNAAMFANLIAAFEAGPSRLQHVHLVHGTKWYGSSHYAGYTGYKTPAREDDPPHQPFNFYHLQQALAAERPPGRTWTWSAVRPHTVCGMSLGYPHNLPLLLGAYAAVCRHSGRPLDFPGSDACWNSVSQSTDAGLLARAMLWAATTPGCAGEAFNIINADYFRWRDLWPRIADCLGMQAGPVRTIRLAEFMADKEPMWNEIVARHGLRPTPFAQLGSWRYADGILRSDTDDMSSTAKSRRFGFHDVVETEEMYRTLFAQLQASKLIP